MLGAYYTGQSYPGQSGFVTSGDVLAVGSATHAHTADSPEIYLGDVTLAMGDALHAHEAGSPVISSLAQLSIHDALHGHGVDSVQLTQQHTLTPVDAYHGHFSSVPNIIGRAALHLDSSLHGHQADGTSIYVSAIQINDSSHQFTSDTISLAQDHHLSVFDVSQSHTADSTEIIKHQPPIDPLAGVEILSDTVAIGIIKDVVALDHIPERAGELARMPTDTIMEDVPMLMEGDSLMGGQQRYDGSPKVMSVSDDEPTLYDIRYR